MRSTNLVLFLVMLNASAGLVATISPVDVDPVTGGDEQIEQSSTELQDNRTVNRRGSGELIASFLAMTGLINTLGNIIFFGAEMLRNLGTPGILVSGFETVFIFVVAFDVAEAVTGRQLS
jgi:hypothetical protein